jgi:ribose-phosphate pyrophosphokinase
MPRRLAICVGPASVHLGEAVCARLAIPPTPYERVRFPDGEVQIELRESLRQRDVFILQSTGPPVDSGLLELLLLADACRRAGAARLTALIPYLGYARQERRAGRRSLGAKVIANLLGTARFDRIAIVDAHTPALEGFFDVPIEHLTAVPLLAEAAAASMTEHRIVVAPDLGAAKRAREFARVLNAPMAVIHKTRISGEQVATQEVIGDVRGRSPLIVDDMLSTGATIEAATLALLAAGAAQPIGVAVTHAVLAGAARDVIERLPLSPLLATDTVAIDAPPSRLRVTSVAPLLADAIRCDLDA